MSQQNLNSSLLLELNKRKIFTCEEQTRKFHQKLLDYYKTGEFCDIILIAGIGEFNLPAHRMVLSASSGYFQAMFRSSLSDANAKEVKLEQWDGETLKEIVNFMYTPSIELRNDNVENILRAADFFQMHRLGEACCLFMTEQLDPCNCLRMVFFAEQHNYTELYEKSLHFACTNFEEVSAEQEFLELNAEQLCRFLSSDNICVSSEKSVLRSLITWIKHDQTNRELLVPSLLEHIRFPLLEPRFIVENREPLCTSFECQKIVLDWIQYLLSPGSRENFPRANTKPRNSSKKLIYITGWETNPNLKVQTYDQDANEWTVLDWPQPLKRRKFFAPAIVDKKLIIAGGDVGGHTTTDVACLDLQTMKWSNMPPLRQPRRWFAMTEMDGYLYAVGGIDSMWTRSVVKYDFRADAWIDLPPVSVGLMYVQTVVLDGLLYAVCSENRSLECFDPHTSKWTKLPYKKHKAAQFGLGAVDGYLYTIGGHFSEGRSKTVERYDPKTGEWTEVCPLSVGRSRIAVATLGNRLIACGGHDGQNFLRIVEAYDPETDVWTTLAPLIVDGDSCSSLLTM